MTLNNRGDDAQPPAHVLHIGSAFFLIPAKHRIERPQEEREREGAIVVEAERLGLSFSGSPWARDTAEMADQYALGWILASLLALIALFRVVAKGKREGGSSARIECVKSAVTSGWDSGSADSNADVVIVGAGVAGSALAYTLGKVNLQSPATLPYCSLSLSFPTSRCFHFFFHCCIVSFSL